MKILNPILLTAGITTIVLGALARTAQTQVYVPVPVYNYYAAISYSESANLSGSAHGAPTQESAASAAIDVCAADGLTDCEVLTTFANTCGALASSHNGAWVTVIRRSASEAQRLALEECNKVGGEDCRIKQALCAKGGDKYTSPYGPT